MLYDVYNTIRAYCRHQNVHIKFKISHSIFKTLGHHWLLPAGAFLASAMRQRARDPESTTQDLSRKERVRQLQRETLAVGRAFLNFNFWKDILGSDRDMGVNQK